MFLLYVHCVGVFDWLLFGVVCGPYQEPAGSEGEDVPVGTEGDGDGGNDAENFECNFICFHCVGLFDWLVYQAVVAERIIISLGQDDMVCHTSAEKLKGGDNSLCQLLVGAGGCKIAGWMVVNEDNVL